MKSKINLWFWGISFVAMVMLFSGSLDSWMLAFFFVTFLFPVIIGTSLYFNDVLVPKYLLTGRKSKFILNFGYLLVISIYLELLVMILSFVVLADYQIENLGEIASDIRFLIVILYFLVFLFGFVKVFQNLKAQEEQLESLKQQGSSKSVSSLELVVNRKTVNVPLDKIECIESLSDYVKVHLEESQLISREKISKLAEVLQSDFVQVHRSFLVNKSKVQSINSEVVRLTKQDIPIGRKYRDLARQMMN